VRDDRILIVFLSSLILISFVIATPYSGGSNLILKIRIASSSFGLIAMTEGEVDRTIPNNVRWDSKNTNEYALILRNLRSPFKVTKILYPKIS